MFASLVSKSFEASQTEAQILLLKQKLAKLHDDMTCLNLIIELEGQPILPPDLLTDD